MDRQDGFWAFAERPLIVLFTIGVLIVARVGYFTALAVKRRITRGRR